jgi:hypothetical protein
VLHLFPVRFLDFLPSRLLADPQDLVIVVMVTVMMTVVVTVILTVVVADPQDLVIKSLF